jgi:cytochrome c oxidase subunit 2
MRGGRRRALWVPAVAVAAVLLSGCTREVERGWLPSTVHTTNQTGRIMSLWNGSWIAALLVGVLVWGLILWAVVAYRRRRDDIGFPAQVRYNIPLEILYTVLPLIMIAVLFFFTARDEAAIADVSAKPDLTINVVGKQWAWDFNYLQEGGQQLNVFEAGVKGELTGQPGVEKELPTL